MMKNLKKPLKRALAILLVVALLITVQAPLRPAFALPGNVATYITDGGVYMLRQVSSGNYMDASGTFDRSTILGGGHSITVQPFTGSATQLWRVNSYDGGYQLRPLSQTDYLLNCYEMKYKDGQPITLREDKTSISNAQRFEFEKMSDGAYQIRTTGNWPAKDFCVGFDGMETVQRPLDDYADRKWYLIEQGTVYYNYAANGGTSASKSSDKLFEGAPVDLTPTAYKYDAQFLGWNTVRTASTGLTSLKMGSENVTLYAIFRSKQTVTYNYAYNGGTNATKSSDSLYEGDNVDLTPTAAKTNAQFVGWNTDPSATTKLTSLQMPSSPLMLYAIFKNKIQVTYNANGGTLSGKSSDLVFAGDPVDLTPAAARTNAAFLGWNITPTATTPLSSFTMPTIPVTLFAIFKDKQSVTYNYTYNGGTLPGKISDLVLEGDNVDLSPTSTKIDARFLGWNTDPNAKTGLASLKMTAAPLTIYAIFENKIQVTYNVTANGGTSPSKTSDKVFAGDNVDLSPTSTKTDARFLGWHTDPASKTPLASLKMPTTPLTLYAIFEDKLQVTYNYLYNGGESATKASDKLYAAETVDLSPTAEKLGWTFLGWNADPDATSGLATLSMPDSALTLYAIFSLETIVKFVDYDDSGAVTRDVSVITYNRDVPSPAAHTLTAPAQNNKTGWTALGWSHLTAADAAPVVGAAGGTTPFQTIYYGLYSKNVMVSYDANGGATTPQSVTKQQLINSYDISAPRNPVFALAFAPKRQYYAFAGWQNGTASYPQGSSATFNANALLTAAWDEIRVDNVRLSRYTMIVGLGESAKIQVFVSPADATNRGAAWASSDLGVASVDQNGVVTARALGMTTITVTTDDGGFTAACNVTVANIAVPVSSVTLSETELELFIGEGKQLSGGILPANATNRSAAWSSSDESVATVDQSGNVTGLGEGDAIITLQSEEGGKLAVCDVTVFPISVAKIALSADDLAMLPGDEAQLVATISPANATDQRYVWESDDTTIATVDQSGKVAARQIGTATITVTTADGGKTASCVVTVDPIRVTEIVISDAQASILIGNSKQLTATVSPANATDQSYIWSSSDRAIADVDQSGKVTALQPGKVSITVKTMDGNKTADCDVTVLPILVTQIDLPQELHILIGDVVLLSATVLPDNATDRSLLWESADSGTAGVDAAGRVTGCRVGTTTITVTSTDGAVTATCNVTVDPIRVTGITISDSTAALLVGDEMLLNATVSPDDATDQSYVWSSSDPSVASVDQSGKVAALKIGTATITATSVDGGFAASCVVTVLPIPVARVALLESVAFVPTGGELALSAVVSPANASDQRCTWASDNPEIVAVDQSGNITGVRAGTATVTVTTVDGGKTGSCFVTVEPVRVTNIAISERQTILAVGDAAVLTAIVSPANATNGGYSWSSADSAVVAVDQSGKVTGLREGVTEIIVTTDDGALEDRCTVWVKSILIGGITLSDAKVNVGESVTMTASISPSNAMNPKLTWFSSDNTIATVDQNGVVTGKAQGIVEITARANDEGGAKATAKVVVIGKEVAKAIALAVPQATVGSADTSGESAGINWDSILDFFKIIGEFFTNLFKWIPELIAIIKNLFPKDNSDPKPEPTPSNGVNITFSGAYSGEYLKVLIYNGSTNTVTLTADQDVTWSLKMKTNNNSQQPSLTSQTTRSVTVNAYNGGDAHVDYREQFDVIATSKSNSSKTCSVRIVSVKDIEPNESSKIVRADSNETTALSYTGPDSADGKYREITPSLELDTTVSVVARYGTYYYVRRTDQTAGKAGEYVFIHMSCIFDPVWPLNAFSNINTKDYYSGGTKHATRYEHGLDLQASVGTAVLATESGSVTTGYQQNGFGYYMEIAHKNGKSSLYAHLSGYVVTSGSVERSSTIAKSGSTGNSTGPHLHFEISSCDVYWDYMKPKYGSSIN
jgi:uncharacterized protein YjdB